MYTKARDAVQKMMVGTCTEAEMYYFKSETCNLKTKSNVWGHVTYDYLIKTYFQYLTLK